MATTWNAAFEASPAGTDSPRFGDDKIRELKSAIQERLVKEHNADLAEASPQPRQGLHKAGSAVIFAQAAAPTQRNGVNLAAADIGVLWLDTDDNILYFWDGSAWVNAATMVEYDNITAALWSYLKDASTTGLVGHWRGDVPEYPDDPAGVTYFQDAWATVDGWATEGGFSTVSVANGMLKSVVNAGQVFNRVSKTVALGTLKTYRIRILASKTGSIFICVTRGGTPDQTIIESTVTANVWKVIDVYEPLDVTKLYIQQTSVVAGDRFEIDWVYVGTGAYLPNSLLDLSGNANHGTIFGCSIVDTPYGRGLQFDGVNDYVSLVNFPLTDAFSLSAQVKIPAILGLTQVIFAQDKGTVPRGILFYASGTTGFLGCIIPTADGADQFITTSSKNICDNTNYLVTLVAIPSVSVTLYVNGVAVVTNTTSVPASFFNNSELMRLGYRNLIAGPLLLAGTIAQPRIYNRALSAEEVWSLYQNPLQGADGLVKAISPAPNSLVTRAANGGLSMRITTLDPKNATAGSRPTGMLGEIVMYSAKLYVCTSATTPTWEAITSA